MGVQVDGINYLIPAGAEIHSQVDVEVEAVDTNWVLKQMAFAGNRMNIIILDACRNNPLPVGTRSLGERPCAHGRADRQLHRLFDGAGRGGHSTAPAPTAPIRRPWPPQSKPRNLPLELLFRQVRVAVMNQTDNKQVPWDSSSLTGEFFFKAPGRWFDCRIRAACARTHPSGGDPAATSAATRTAHAQPERGSAGAARSALHRLRRLSGDGGRALRPLRARLIERR